MLEKLKMFIVNVHGHGRSANGFVEYATISTKVICEKIFFLIFDPLL